MEQRNRYGQIVREVAIDESERVIVLVPTPESTAWVLRKADQYGRIMRRLNAQRTAVLSRLAATRADRHRDAHHSLTHIEQRMDAAWAAYGSVVPAQQFGVELDRVFVIRCQRERERLVREGLQAAIHQGTIYHCRVRRPRPMKRRHDPAWIMVPGERGGNYYA